MNDRPAHRFFKTLLFFIAALFLAGLTPIFTGSISVIIRPELCSPNNFNGHII